MVLVEPRRLRDRATELLDEEVALAESLATTWGARSLDSGVEMPRLHLGFDRLLARTPAKVASFLPVAENARTVTLQASGWPPSLGDSAGLARRFGELAGAGNTVVICADGRGSAERMAGVLEDEGLSCDLLDDKPTDDDRHPDPPARGAHRRRPAGSRARSSPPRSSPSSPSPMSRGDGGLTVRRAGARA